jgi:hypothetical protein
MEKKTSPATKQGQSNTRNNSTADQRVRLEAEIRKHPVSTIYARDELDIMAPAARLLELRYDYGLNIQTHWKTEKTSCGKKHRVAEYVLFPGQWEGKES